MLSSPEKWEAGLKELQSSNCGITHLSLIHNQPSHMQVGPAALAAAANGAASWGPGNALPAR